MNKFKVLLSVFILLLSSNAFADRYWPTKTLTNWSLYLNNNVAYIKSKEIATHCVHERAQITLDGKEYNKALYSYALSAKAKGKKLRYVVDNTQTICIISALQEID